MTPSIEPLPQLEWLISFAAVAKEGSMTQAAARLNVPVQRISLHIQHLEKHLRLILFYRNTRRMRLSLDGEAYLGRIAPILDQFLGIHRELQHHEYMLRVGASTSLALRIILPRLHQFYEQNPKTKLNLILNDEMSDFIREALDVTVRLNLPEHLPDTMISQTLAHTVRYVCASPQYLAKHGIPETPKDLENHRCLVFSSNVWADRVWSFEHQQHGSIQIEVEAYFSSNLGRALTEAACQGMGIAQKSSWDIKNELASGALVRILEDYHVPGPDIVAIYPTAHRLSPCVKAWVNFLKDIFDQK
jgi:DNA-binding transcriptional LysR family regulator